MALFAGELNEVAPKRPVDVCVVGTYIFSAFQNDATSGLMPYGAFAVLSTSTEVALAYTGLPSSQGVGNFNAFSAASGGGYGGATWEVVQGHTTQKGWEPDRVPSLWKKVA